MTTFDLSQRQLDAAPPDSVDQAHPWSLTVEQLAYLALGVLALIAHLWALGDRALHHDETLHASYSWFLFVGRGYIHDPLLHGPLLYYLGALGYFLFGDNDFTARLMPALAGTALTLLPYLLRRELGRPAALIAAVYLLISPVALYVGRFFRHDIYSVVCELLVFVAIVRYVSSRQLRWLLVGSTAFGLMFVNLETSYLFLLIMAAPLAIAFLWQVYKPGIPLVLLLGVMGAALIFVLPGKAKVDGAHNALRDPETGAMQIERPGFLGWAPLPTDDNGYALRVRNRADNDGGRSLLENLGLYLGEVWKFFGHPAIMLAMGLTLGTITLLIHLIWRRSNADGVTPWQVACERQVPAAIAFGSLGQGWRWFYALSIFLAIYLIFFSAFFTNMIGMVSGVTGSFLYWLAQHNVERGGQPGHYYLFLLAVYEPLLLLFVAIGLGFVAYDLLGLRRSVEAEAEQGQTEDPFHRTFCIPFLAWWGLASLGIYTWAGEKMPWLTIHISLPFTLLAAWALQRIIWGARPAPDGPGQAPQISAGVWALYGSLFAIVIGLGFALMSAVVDFPDAATVMPYLTPALIVLATVALIFLLTLSAGFRYSFRPALILLTVCMVFTLSLYTVRNSVRLAFVHGDVPVEPLVYTQTSPDVMRIVRRIEEASIRRGHGLAMPVIYDNETVWTWYLRNFNNAERSSGQLLAPPDAEVMAVVMLQENLDRHPENRRHLEEFVIQRYPLRWWFPEDEIYRLRPNWREVPLTQTSLLGQFLRAPLEREVGERMWRFLLFRDPGAPLGSTDMIIAVRPSIADQIGLGLGE
ncbi:flippase activity-associated protein Agl23 [Candidatus Viridilinea mediisalina]|uniref:Glycosyl transferase n=1 Tax=Candidatus Viridilinea mediisalina TaxID=2024553 RepID=A0A2A6RNP9_9CHLR|nr:flippase activity-associated protein Agl23 [Candidatus Viridilinea mediisalina]PDW04546.1 glycosyl transferase [Candidatus Viridilinea mediisalina]